MSREEDDRNENKENFNSENGEIVDDGAGVSPKKLFVPVPLAPASMIIEQNTVDLSVSNPLDTSSKVANSPGQGDPEFLNYPQYSVPLGTPEAPMHVLLQADPKLKKNQRIALIISIIVSVLVFVSIFLSNGGGDQLGAGGKGFNIKTHHALIKNCPVRFSDIHGCDEVKQELQLIVNFFKNPADFNKFGAVMPRGYLLAGPPGVGKTMLAKAVAGEAGVPFLTISGAEFDEMFVGVGANRVRVLFDDARKLGKAIIFIDEIDAIASKRNITTSESTERARTVNELLVQMDGFKTVGSEIVVLAATNSPESLDPAILRSGRFDKIFVLTPPNLNGRISLLKHLINQIGKDIISSDLKDNEKLRLLAEMTSGYTGADLANLVNRTKLEASMDTKASKITMDHFYRAYHFLSSGSKSPSTKDKERLSYREAGRIIVSDYYAKKNQNLGIIVDYVNDKSSSRISTLSSLQESLDLALVGQVAEELHYTDLIAKSGKSSYFNPINPKNFISTESKASMTRIYDIAKNIVYSGHGAKTGNFIPDDTYLYFSESVKKNFEDDVRLILAESLDRVKGILNSKKRNWEKLAEGLIRNQYLTQEQIKKILDK